MARTKNSDRLSTEAVVGHRSHKKRKRKSENKSHSKSKKLREDEKQTRDSNDKIAKRTRHGYL